MQREPGTLVQWNDERGFGFILPDAGGPRVFAHVSAFPRGRRPVDNDLVTFASGLDGQNRLHASHVRYVVRSRPVPRGHRRRTRAVALAGVFFVVVAVLVAAQRVPWVILPAYALLSLMAFSFYRADKVAAQSGDWRISESTLLLMALIGGWPGALVARHLFRHKTTKQPFRALFWLSVAVHCAGLAWFAYEMPLTVR